MLNKTWTSVLTILRVGVGDLESADGTLGFGPRHCQRVFCHLAEDDVGGRLRAWTVRRIPWEVSESTGREEGSAAKEEEGRRRNWWNKTTNEDFRHWREEKEKLTEWKLCTLSFIHISAPWVSLCVYMYSANIYTVYKSYTDKSINHNSQMQVMDPGQQRRKEGWDLIVSRSLKPENESVAGMNKNKRKKSGQLYRTSEQIQSDIKTTQSEELKSEEIILWMYLFNLVSL